MNTDVTLACELCCVTNGYLQSFVWDVKSFCKREKKCFLNKIDLKKIDLPYCLVVFFVVYPRLRPCWSVFGELALFCCSTAKRKTRQNINSDWQSVRRSRQIIPLENYPRPQVNDLWEELRIEWTDMEHLCFEFLEEMRPGVIFQRNYLPQATDTPLVTVLPLLSFSSWTPKQCLLAENTSKPPETRANNKEYNKAIS